VGIELSTWLKARGLIVGAVVLGLAGITAIGLLYFTHIGDGRVLPTSVSEQGPPPRPSSSPEAKVHCPREPVAPLDRPSAAKASADRTLALVGQAVQFNSAGSSGPGGAKPSCSWNFGDRTTSTQAAPAHAYAAPGAYKVRLTVRGPGSGTDTAEISVLIMRIDRLAVAPPATTLYGDRKQQFVAVGTWHGPDDRPGTADDVTREVTGLVSWRVEPRRAGRQAPGKITPQGLFISGDPDDEDESLRGYVCASAGSGTQARGEVDVHKLVMVIEWVTPAP